MYNIYKCHLSKNIRVILIQSQANIDIQNFEINICVIK